ncbi:MAG TPA: phenylalanine--tRNA ligase subunit alpha [Caldisericia bacterium]|nr:phenylalanine--tRNA ligase subunit alpha [Caldisericia bacterium]HPF49028.1 phenylalanine--tRNA ligase subunit alpha [Caldisericia bacterium]HPI83108.1 phenylalanine--tRNA ligase subunit alpha [Caldisericia bacterium]HPQ92335.1 phenylalanine--tRNA ligase subunit alpha [Caldisericia bacterium]HRV74567.1 phenylalanine--tRNA ligase subunit alpha [Caldisericia bacterium]
MDFVDVKQRATDAIKSAQTSVELENIRVAFLGRKGEITVAFKQMAELEPEQKKEFAKNLNILKNDVTSELDAKQEILLEKEKNEKILSEKIDHTMPGRRWSRGTLHPLTIVQQEIADVFHSIGFEVRQGQHIEDDFHNFEALNFPPFHPARAMQDTFYVDGGKLLRTHTSPTQVRTMESKQPPIRMIAMGTCFRTDATDASHMPVFHQLEGLMIDKHITFSDLAGILSLLLSEVFGHGTKVKFLPSYFPFVEPGAETLASCPFCGGEGCRTCQQSGWIEMGGSGMVHPNVLRNVGYDPEVYQGFAFGWGIERIAMLKFGISDIRDFYTGDTRFLAQFGGVR